MDYKTVAVVPGNIKIEDLLLISQPSLFFSNISGSLITPKQTKQKKIGASESKTSQLCQGISRLRTSC
jgi:hypothetical protein